MHVGQLLAFANLTRFCVDRRHLAIPYSRSFTFKWISKVVPAFEIKEKPFLFQA